MWDAARAARRSDDGERVAIAAAAALAFDAAFANGKDCVQTLGGIGFTWEHDAHMYLRRAMTLHQLVGNRDEWRIRAARERMAGAAAGWRSTSPPKPRRSREVLRAFLAEIEGLAGRRAAHATRRRRVPHTDVAAARGVATPTRSSCS